jgi:mannose-6-phosphate isomerase-like protein (cupin superfamily)
VTEPKDVTMLEKHQLKTLSDAVSEVWKNVNFAKVNGHDVRLRVVTDRAANFHAHEDSDELFCCLEGTAHLDTVDGSQSQAARTRRRPSQHNPQASGRR